MAIKQLKDLDTASNVQSTDGILVIQGGSAKKATVADLPGGSAPVISVNSKTGAVVLSAADVGAMSTSHAANAITGLGESGSSLVVVRYDDARLTDARLAADVYAWAKAATKPTYTYSEVGAAASNHTHSGVYQPVDANLTAIAGLSGTSGLLKKTAADTWALDTAAYLTGNQTITVSGDATGSGSTSIALTLANSGVTAGTYTKLTVDAKGRTTAGSAATTSDIAESSNLYFTNARALAAAPAETTTTTGTLINGATAKTTPVDADMFGLMDSAASNVLKKLSWANIKATLKTYFDTLYALTGHLHTGTYEPANANIQTHIGSTSNPHSTTAAQVGAPTTTGTGASGTWGVSVTGSAARMAVPDTRNAVDQPQNKTGNSITADFKLNTSVNSPPVTASGTYSHIITVAGWDTLGGSGGWPTQLSIGNGIAVRQAVDASTWGAWRTLIHSANYNSYSPTLAGTGASGTWNISVTGNSSTTSQRTFGNVRTDGINRGSYGSISIAGGTSGYSGIDFTDELVTLMVDSQYQGMMYNNASWIWYFNNGVLEVGTVPYARTTGCAPINSPSLTGTPTAPTAAVGTNTTQIATTAFVANAVASAGTPVWQVKSAAYTAVSTDKLLANTSSAGWTLTLPASPGTGATVEVADYNGSFAANNLTIGRNGSTIMGLAEDLIIDLNNAAFGIVYTGTTWRIAP